MYKYEKKTKTKKKTSDESGWKECNLIAGRLETLNHQRLIGDEGLG